LQQQLRTLQQQQEQQGPSSSSSSWSPAEGSGAVAASVPLTVWVVCAVTTPDLLLTVIQDLLLTVTPNQPSQAVTLAQCIRLVVLQLQQQQQQQQGEVTVTMLQTVLVLL
jgi:hypothetical protein